MILLQPIAHAHAFTGFASLTVLAPLPTGAITSPAAPPGSIPGTAPWTPGGGPASWSPTTGTVPSVTSGIEPRPFAVSGVMVNTETITVIAPPQRARSANQRITCTPYQA